MPKKMDQLEPVSDLKTVQRYFRYGLELHEIISCYIEDADLRFDAAFKSVDTGSLTLEMEIAKESFAKLVTENLVSIERPQSPIRISFSVNEASFFAFTKFQVRQARRLVVKAELPMYKLQRRAALRIKVLESHKATLKLTSDFAIPIFDISAGGLSILVKESEQRHYKKGDLFPNATLSFASKEIKVDLEVKNILSHSKDGLMWKIGLSFQALPASVEQMIAREAYLHTHKIWSRWL